MVWLMVFLGGIAFALVQGLIWGGVRYLMGDSFKQAARIFAVAGAASLLVVWGLWLVAVWIDSWDQFARTTTYSID